MTRHTMIYVDVSYIKDPTQIVVIKEDSIREMFTLSPQTEFLEVVDRVIDLVSQYDLRPDQVRAYGQPALEHAVRSRMNRSGAV